MDSQNETIVTGIIKKSEHLEMRKKQLEHLRQSDDHHLVDLEKFNREGKQPEPISKLFYIEEFIQEDDRLRNLYPYPSSRKNYVKPYLTPQKHLEYASFWALSSFIGLFAIKFVSKKWV